MIYIRKKPEPPGLRNYKTEKQRKRETPNWKEFSEVEEFKAAFDELRQSLVDEQHSICCYCQQRISFKNDKTGMPLMKTEHFEPKGGKNAVPEKQLQYDNLLAACLGNSDTEMAKHCDSYKLGQILQAVPNPAAGKRKDFKPFLKYQVRVNQKEVVVLPLEENELLNQDIEQVLNLNEQTLRSKRFSTWQSVWRQISNKNGPMKIRKIEQIIEVYTPANQSEYKPFCGFIISWLKKHLQELKAS